MVDVVKDGVDTNQGSKPNNPTGAVEVTDVGPVVDVADGLQQRLTSVSTTTQPDAQGTVEGNTSLKRFEADYDKISPDLQAKCPWETAKARLLANDGLQLKRAEAMEQGGILFGVDENGKVLFADKGDEPIMKGMNYKDTRDRVLYKHDHLDKEGKIQLGEDNKPISTGYEMFPYSGDYDKSDEILQYESYTGKPFLKSTNVIGYVSSWLESGEDPFSPRDIVFNLRDGNVYIYDDDFNHGLNQRGVRRLLRV